MSTCCESSSVDRMNWGRSDETSFRKTDRHANIILTDRQTGLAPRIVAVCLSLALKVLKDESY